MEKRQKSDLYNRHLAAKHQHSTHLKKNPESVSNIVSIEFFEALSTISTLEQKCIAQCSLTKFFLKAPGLAGKDNRGESVQSPENRF